MPDNFEDAILPEGFNPESESQGFFEEPVGGADSTNGQADAENLVNSAGDAAPSPTTDQGAEVPAQTITLRYNHEERQIGLDEAATLAQKGLNYDKVNSRNQELEANRAEDEWLAKQLGYDNSREMMAAAKQNFVNRQINELIEAGNTEAMARFLVDQQMKASSAVPQTQPAYSPEVPSQAKPAMTLERREELLEFARAYPGVIDLPNEVIEMNHNGVRLKAAYEMHKNKQELAQKTKELAVLKQNQAAARKAPVTGATGKSTPASTKPEEQDAFLRGFNIEF